MLCYLHTLGNLSFFKLPPCAVASCSEKGQTWRKTLWRLMKMCSCSFYIGLTVWRGRGTVSLDQGEFKVILVVCPTPPTRPPSGFQENSGPSKGSNTTIGGGGSVWIIVQEGALYKKGELHFWRSSTLSTFLLLCVTLGNNNWLVGLCLCVGALKSINSTNQFKENGRQKIRSYLWRIMQSWR